MAKACYVGIDGKARKVKKIYTGVSNVARKVKKGYVGVGGVARPFYSAEPEVVYYGTASTLDVARGALAATTVGNYALFGGGYRGAAINSVTAYTSNLAKSTPTSLMYGRRYLAANTVGNYALFGGGEDPNDSEFKTVDAYSDALVRSTPTGLREERKELAATTVGNYALFGGGRYGYTNTTTVDAYSDTLVHSTPAEFSDEIREPSATTVGDYALFTGANYTNGTAIGIVNAYSRTLVRSTPTGLSLVRFKPGATTVGGYALFGGGNIYDESGLIYGTATVDAYSRTLVRSTLTELSVARYDLFATTVGRYALFGGGHFRKPDDLIDGTATVDAYSDALVRRTPDALSQGRGALAATTVGNYALFGGGNYGTYSNMYSDVVDVYTITQ